MAYFVIFIYDLWLNIFKLSSFFLFTSEYCLIFAFHRQRDRTDLLSLIRIMSHYFLP